MNNILLTLLSMDKLFLRFVSLFYPLLARTGVDTEQLNEILRIKLLMDTRRPKGTFNMRKNAQTGKQQSPWLASFFTLLMGFFIGLLLTINQKPYVGETYYFVVFMVLMSITLISDFTTVLIDTRDQFILLPRPVNDRTIAISRILHISIYVLKLALLQCLPGLVIVGFVDGIFAVPIFFIQVLEATFLSIFMVNIIYLLLMRSVSPQRFKDIISYFQIGFSVLVFISYYLLPKLINVSVMGDVNLLSHWWAYLLAPVWIASLNELLIHSSRSGGLVTSALAILGLVLPVAGLWFVAKVLAPGFNRRLTIIATSDGNTNNTGVPKKAGKFNFIAKLSNLLAPDPLENAGFRITWKLSARTREFKMKVYPMFAFVPVYFLYFALNGKSTSLSDRLDKLQNGHSYVFLIYLSTIILSAFLTNISWSEKYKSAWVYYALPISEPGKILSGMYKAIVAIYFLPYCLVLSIVIVFIWGPQAINDLILAFLISLIYGILMALFLVKGLPFSKPVIVKQRGGKMITSLMIMAFIAGIGFGHYYLMQWENVVWIAILPALLINWIMFRQYKKQTWDNIEYVEI
jgi:ABC-2 type transport system permease protein